MACNLCLIDLLGSNVLTFCNYVLNFDCEVVSNIQMGWVTIGQEHNLRLSGMNAFFYCCANLRFNNTKVNKSVNGQTNY